MYKLAFRNGYFMMGEEDQLRLYARRVLQQNNKQVGENDGVFYADGWRAATMEKVRGEGGGGKKKND